MLLTVLNAPDKKKSKEKKNEQNNLWVKLSKSNSILNKHTTNYTYIITIHI